MTGYEIYDEGYEAGYESAMEDLMEAMEDGKLRSKPLTQKQKEAARKRSDPDHMFNLGRKYGYHNEIGWNESGTDKGDYHMTKSARIDRHAEDVMYKNDHPYKKIGPHYDDAYHRGQRIGRAHANGAKIHLRKGNEALFDFDDIDHAYLDDEYDDFDYE